MPNIELYRQAINKIDDYFEYSNESAKDKRVVMKIIDQLTDRLVNKLLNKSIIVYYVIENDGAGSAYLTWFMTLKQAERYEDNTDDGFSDSTIGSVETLEGSDIYFKALETDKLNRLVNNNVR